MDVYKELGVKTYINAWDTMSLFGGSRMELQTVESMREAARDFVKIEELEEKVGQEIARLTHNEAAFITCGASSGILISTAVAMCGHDAAKLKALPATEGVKNEVIIMKPHHNVYDFAVGACGAKPLVVGDENGCTEKQFLAAFTDMTALVLFVDADREPQNVVSLKRVCELAHARGVKVVVDAAAQLPPVSNLWHYTEECGADAALFSGGKGLRGSQQAGLCVGKKDFISAFKLIAPPNQGVARSEKTGREEIIAEYAAIKKFMTEGVMEDRLEYIERSVERVKDELEATGMFSCEKLYPGPTGQHYYWLSVTPLKGISAGKLAANLKEGPYGILVGGNRDINAKEITVNALNLEPYEVDIVIDQIIAEARKLSA